MNSDLFILASLGVVGVDSGHGAAEQLSLGRARLGLCAHQWQRHLQGTQEVTDSLHHVPQEQSLPKLPTRLEPKQQNLQTHGYTYTLM